MASNGNWIGAQNITSQILKHIFIKGKVTKIDNSFTASKFVINDVPWNAFEYCFTGDTFLRSLNYRILTNSYTTRMKLAMYKIIDTDICPMCGEEVDDLRHSLLECPLSSITWGNMQHVLTMLGIHEELTKTDIIFGVSDKWPHRHVINTILCRIKHKMISTANDERIITISNIISIIRGQLKIEEHSDKIRVGDGMKPKFIKRWGSLLSRDVIGHIT